MYYFAHDCSFLRKLRLYVLHTVVGLWCSKIDFRKKLYHIVDSFFFFKTKLVDAMDARWNNNFTFRCGAKRAPKIASSQNIWMIYIRTTLNDLVTPGSSFLRISLVRFSLIWTFKKSPEMRILCTKISMSERICMSSIHSRQKCLPHLIILVHKWAFLGQADEHEY